MFTPWKTLFFEPIYNALVWFTLNNPWLSVAFGVILTTLLVKIILLPLSYRVTKAQLRQKQLQPHINAIKKQYTDPKEQAEKIMAFYKENKSNPFSGCLLVLLQLPIILALYRVFLDGVFENQDLLYAGLSLPENLNLMLFNQINLEEQSIILAVLAAVAQAIHLRLTMRLRNQNADNKAVAETLTDQEKMAQTMQKSTQYFLPVMIAVFAYIVPAAVALYWVVSNLFAVVQEFIVQKILASKAVVVQNKE